jgi:hypothetical protein
MISKFEDNIDSLCDKIKVPNEYRELAIMIYQQMGNLLDYKVSNYDDHDNLLSLIKKLDIRKKERMNNFFNIAKALASNTSTNIDFFTSLISKIDKYRLGSEHKSKNNLEIKKIIMRPHPRDNLKRLKKLCKSNQISIEENLIDVVSHCNKYDTKIIHFGSSSSIELKGKNINSNFIYSEKLLKKHNLKIPKKIYKNSNPINIDEKSFNDLFNSLVQNKSKILNLENNISKLIADEILKSINEKIHFNNSESIKLSSLFNKFNFLKVNLFTLIGRNRYALTKCNKLTKDQKLLLKELFPNLDLTFKGEIIVANG